MEKIPNSVEIIAPDLDTAIAQAQEELGVPAKDLEAEIVDDENENTDGGLTIRVRVLMPEY